MSLELLVIIGIAVCLFLAVCIILFVLLYQRRVIAYQQQIRHINEQNELELIQASIRSEEQERQRIAAELHDDVGVTLASARLFLYHNKGAAPDEQAVLRSKELLDEGISKIRSISHKLQPATLQYLGLSSSLHSLVETIGQSGAVTANCTVPASLPRLAAQTELAVYRITQELLANMIRHAQTTVITLNVLSTEQELSLVFTYNGNGMTQVDYDTMIYKKGATGLKNIVNRLKSVHASLQFYRGEAPWYGAVLVIPLIPETTA